MHDDHPTAATCEPTGTPLPVRTTRLPSISPRYTLIAPIGAGSMGKVYRAHDAVLDRVCALKLFVPGKGRPRVEARLAASLSHPSIVPVHDFGTLPDGRPWMVMQLVEGADLNALIATRGLDRRRLLEHLLRVARGVAHAHGSGIVHRDLKPDNIRIDAHDAVFILDWGIAERVGEPGARIGSVKYRAPEQGAGAISQPTMDVFSLGRLLNRILDAHAPDAREVGPLRALVERCTHPDPSARPADAQIFAAALVDWFDGVARQREADALIAEADEAMTRAQAARADAAQRRARGAALLAKLEAFAPVEEKFAGWAEEDAATESAARARRLEVKAEQLLQDALRRVDGLQSAVDRLGDLAMQRLRHAHATGDRVRAADARDRLLVLDSPAAQQLDRPQTIRLHTDPPGAEVYAARFEMRNRRLVPVGERSVGRTPLEIALRPGSHRLRIVSAGRPPVILPIFAEWADPVEWIAPGDARPAIIPIPKTLGDNERYVPAGWCRVGGDEWVSDSLPGQRVWVDGFVIEAEPLTCGALVAGLNAMLDAGETALAEVVGRLPMEGDGLARLTRRPDGRFAFTVKDDLDVSAWPATQLDWNAARGWAEWRRRQTGQPWRLADEIEWEKAARGADGRLLPWGDYFEPTWACVVGSRPGDPRRGPTRDWPLDVSVYGVLGMAGNARTWCRNKWTQLGECRDDRLMLGPIAREARHRILRGGFYLARSTFTRPAGRYASPPDKSWTSSGVRLVRSITG